mgnify:CR=1 FL=1
MNEMVEKVAKGLCRLRVENNEKYRHDTQKHSKEFIDRAIEAGYHNFLDEARAAIEAMKEPTEEMCDNAHLMESLAASTCKDVWEDMIEAALKDG